ncbi:MAG: hypothetical protein KME26_12545 [Oscillatoria princeps RMCB-10]|nr:hypothetical protein [Oscillatoria princeps RMCB-10]
MKCVQCGMDNDLKERTDNGGRCKNCNHPFAFEPSAVTDYRFRFTDAFFAKAIEDISTNNTLFHTPKQLFYLLDKRLNQKHPIGNIWQGLGCIILFFSILYSLVLAPLNLPIYLAGMLGIILFMYGCFEAIKSTSSSLGYRETNIRCVQVVGAVVLVGGIVWSLIAENFLLFMFSISAGILSIYLAYRQSARQAYMPQDFFITQEQFQTWLNRWQEINNPVGKMLPPPREERLPAEVSTELTAYSFDRAVICDSAVIAQVLIANNFHFENNCAVLSVTGYPQSIFSTVLEMLTRNPDLKVYALHDASPRGVTLTYHLRTSPNWFQNCNVAIYDLGLLPRQIFASRNVFVRASEESARDAKQMPAEVRQSLSASELEWLEAGNFVELESFTPQKLIQVLNQGIAQSQSATAGDSLVVIDGGGGYLYAADSFG